MTVSTLAPWAVVALLLCAAAGTACGEETKADGTLLPEAINDNQALAQPDRQLLTAGHRHSSGTSNFNNGGTNVAYNPQWASTKSGGGALAQNSNSQASGGAIGTKGFTNTGNSNINAQQNKFTGRKLFSAGHRHSSGTSNFNNGGTNVAYNPQWASTKSGGGALAQNSNSQASGGAIGTKGFTNTGNSNINAQQNKVFPGRKLLTKI